MSTTRYSRDGLTVTTFAGPAEHSSPNSNSRIMVQITTRDGGYVQLPMDHWIDLVCFIRGMDAQGAGIMTVPEVPGE